jgi:hypothetical protein
MSLQTELLRPSDAIRNEDLAHIMRLSRRKIALDDIFQRARKHLSVRVACQAAWRIGRQYNDYWAGYIAGRVGVHPRVVMFGLSRRAGGRDLF